MMTKKWFFTVTLYRESLEKSYCKKGVLGLHGSSHPTFGHSGRFDAVARAGGPEEGDPLIHEATTQMQRLWQAV